MSTFAVSSQLCIDESRRARQAETMSNLSCISSEVIASDKSVYNQCNTK